MCFLTLHLSIPPPGTTILLPKRPPKTTEDKEETIQKLEVRKNVNRELLGPSFILCLLAHVCLNFSYMLTEFESLHLYMRPWKKRRKKLLQRKMRRKKKKKKRKRKKKRSTMKKNMKR